MDKSKHITCLVNLSLLFFIGCSSLSKIEPFNKKTEPQQTERVEPSTKGNSNENQKTVKIGIVLPLTGTQSHWGQDALKGVRLSFDNATKNGFFKSKPIDLIESDSCSQKEGARKAVTKLIDLGVVGIIGELDSELSLEVAKICFERGVPMISLAATYPKLTTIGNNVFRVCYTDEFQGSLLAKFAFNECNIQNMGVFTEKKNIFSESLNLYFSEAFKKLGGQVSEQNLSPTDERKFIPALKTMQTKECQGLLISGFFKKSDLILKQARKLNFDTYRFGGDGWDRKNMTNRSKAGSFYSTHYNLLDERPESQSFVEAWEEVYKSLPTSVPAALGYDAALVMSYGIKNSRKFNSVELIKSLNNLEKVPGVTGEINFKNRKGDPDKQGIICTLTTKGPVFHQSYEYQEILP